MTDARDRLLADSFIYPVIMKCITSLRIEAVEAEEDGAEVEGGEGEN